MCLLLFAALLMGCAHPEKTQQSETAPDPSGAAVDFQATQEANAELTEQALSAIRVLGESPDDQYRTWYEIFVYSFCDSDGDGIGDLQGVISKLDYLQELGITGIWLMPVHPSGSYHKYNVSDYYGIDPDYGTLDDMDALLVQCEQRGIRVILDLVVNHTGADHAWFQTAVSYLRKLGDGRPDAAECPYFNYYCFTREPGSGYTQVEETDWYYESRFSPDMPELNLESEAVRAEIREIMQFWLDRGVAGFRLDAAKEYYTGNTERSVEALAWIRETAASIRKDVYLVAEVWDSFAAVTAFYQSGITSIFNYPFGDATGKIMTVLRGAGNPGVVSTYATALEKANNAYSGANPDYVDAPFLSNHDVGRIASFCGGDLSKTKLAGAMNLFMSGSAFVYYGEELGMTGSGNDPSKRAPMYWNAARNNGTTREPPACVLPESYPFGALDEQVNDDDSVYNYYRQAIAIRNAIPAISHGATTAETNLNFGCVSAFRKQCDLGTCIVLMNIDTAAAQVDLTGYENWTLAATLPGCGDPVVLTDGILTLPAFGTAVLLPAP